MKITWEDKNNNKYVKLQYILPGAIVEYLDEPYLVLATENFSDVIPRTCTLVNLTTDLLHEVPVNHKGRVLNATLHIEKFQEGSIRWNL